MLVQSVTYVNHCYWRSKFYIAGIQILNLFLFTDLDMMTYIYQLDLYFVENYCMRENELHMSRLRKVIV